MSETLAQPVVYEAKSVPRKIYKTSCNLNFDSGRFIFNKTALDRLQIGDDRYVAFVEFKGDLYVTRTKATGFWMNIFRKDGVVTAGHVCHKVFIQQLMRRLDAGPGQGLSVQFARHKVTAAELNLDPEQYPNTLFRFDFINKKLKPVQDED